MTQTIKIENWSGDQVGELALNEAIFTGEVNQTLVWESVRHHLAGLRHGNHKVKEKGEVRGSGKKPWRQKGTGRARAGMVRSPLWRGGGIVHGPRVRDYSYAFPRKKLVGAIKSVLNDKLNNESLRVLETIDIDTFKTKEMVARLGNLGLGDKKVLVIGKGMGENIQRATGNIVNVKAIEHNEVSAYELVKYETVIMSKDAMEQMFEVLS